MMGLYLPIGLRFIISLQNMVEWLKPVMVLFTWLGNPMAYMVIIAIIYWSFDRKLGLRLAIFLTVAASTNSILKQAIHAPRPYWADPHIKAIKFSNGFGMPSGHAQAATAWIYAASLLRRGWFRITAIIMVVLVGFSRIYLGVHFTGQVLAGWMIGILVAVLFIRFESGVIRKLLSLNTGKQIVLVFSISMILILLGAVFAFLLDKWEFPAEWIRNAADDLPDKDVTILSSIGLHAVAGYTGGFMGVCMGAILSHSQGGFDVRGSWWNRVLRCLIGLGVISLLYAAFNLIDVDKTQELLYSIWEFSRFFCISISVIFLVPSLLIRLNLLSK